MLNQQQYDCTIFSKTLHKTNPVFHKYIYLYETTRSKHISVLQVTASVEHFDIYEAVFSMLRQLHQHSQGANTVAFVIGSLHECVREEFDSSKHDVSSVGRFHLMIRLCTYYRGLV